MTISHGKDAMYFSRLFFPVLEFFAWQIEILQEWKKFNYYSRITKHCTENIIYGIDYQRLFPYIFSPANIWNELGDKSDEEESISNDCTLYSDNICIFISKLWNEREKNTNTDYDVTGWMLCVIPHIREDIFKKAQNNHHIQVNTVIKSVFAGSTENI